MKYQEIAPRCETCAYWEADYDQDDDGQTIPPTNGNCLRHAPRPLVLRGSEQYDPNGEDGRRVVYPYTSSLDWCGDHVQDRYQ